MELKTFIESGFSNLALIEEKYGEYSRKPTSVDPTWRRIFDEWDSFQAKTEVSPKPAITGEIVLKTVKAVPATDDIRVYNLIQGYRQYGHLMAAVNPIATRPLEEPPELKLESYNFAAEDLERFFSTFGLLPANTATLQDIIDILKKIYCGKIGVEYVGLQSPELEKWLQQKLESRDFRNAITIRQKKMILEHLNKSELLESFLHTKYVGQKRFSIEGGETLIPMLAALIEKGADHGMEECVIGMAHRGRLNVLCNILNKSYSLVFSEFDESYIPNSFEGSGDVKYHKGFFAEVATRNGRKVRVDLSPNPSHLEAVDPVVEGMVRAKQVLGGDEAEQLRFVPVLIHGDAAIAGQGIIYETLQMCRLQGYSTGGTLHCVINNQIGFTTLPKDSRSTRYCTDIAKAFGAPVFHVNAEDPEGCVLASYLAMEMRQKFHCEVFIDLNCYRKYGHNEGDEPAFTQPLEYQLIRKKKPIRELYRDKLINEGVVERQIAEQLESEFKKSLNEALQGLKLSGGKPSNGEPPVAKRSGNGGEHFNSVATAVPKEILEAAAFRFCEIPEGFNIHPKLKGLIQHRLSMVQDDAGGKLVDWGMGETLAYASLLWEGVSIRISGQDCCRGTFSHRHALWMDQIQENAYYPLKHLKPDQGRFDIYNSPLSENGVLGFEFGYSESNPNALVIWEAQFGDFTNGAQTVIDQFIVCCEQKWGLKSGLTLFLPHGYEGQGPEHSSARIERFLSLAGHSNIRIVNPTTPAQLFHLLRKQALNPVKKPLIVFTPKGLLRHPDVVNRLADFTTGSFEEILDDPEKPLQAHKLVLCSGRIFYDIAAMRSKLKDDGIAIVRIEQLYPLHSEKIKAIVSNYHAAKELYWMQEEPSNMGAWDYLLPLLREMLPPYLEPKYIGRTRSASTAVGSHALHKREAEAIMKALFKT